MKIKVLGAHCLESANTRLTSLLIDDILALDAGGLTSALTFEDQRKLRAVLLTHRHFDHVRDVALVGYYNALLPGPEWKDPKRAYSTSGTLDNIMADILNGQTFPDFTRPLSSGKVPLQLCPLEPYKPEVIEGYTVMAIPVKHSVPTVGYSVTSPRGRTLFFTGDTGPGIADCWEHVSPDLLITEITGTNALEERMVSVGHLTPNLLHKELSEFKRIKGYIPPVVLVHISPELEDLTREEVQKVAKQLGADIKLGYEGMTLTL